MAQVNSMVKLRDRLADHGYHVFLRPDRTAGWWVVLRRAGEGRPDPVEVHAPSRDEAVQMAERLFVTRRISELDAAIRAAGHIPPVWDQTSQSARLDCLADYARDRRILA